MNMVISDETTPEETDADVGAVLARIGAEVAGALEEDQGLLDIVRRHIFVTKASRTAVEEAASEVIRLAEALARSGKA